MPLALEIVLMIIGILLLAAALIGSGISRRLMTIPKMHRTPRVALAILGVLLLTGGMWGVATQTKTTGPTLAELKKHIPPAVKSALSCTESTETPKGTVEMECDSPNNSYPEQVWYTLFRDVNSMQDYWTSKSGPDTLTGTQCATTKDFKTGSKQTYSLSDETVIVGDYACLVSGNTAIGIYTDRRYNIVVFAQDANPQHFSNFVHWMFGDTSQPVGDETIIPPTPSHTVAARP
ncbi:hypothetical protein ABT075_29170 [Streptomyces sp. NPDC002677]|uniref:hypothetical protein n=1 Tax=Streptomyces sp. NPDC002677 TaxID=3154774 RepID=UPI003325808D